ncbi:MAG TPA: heme ABC exporter ATP-binding protein CcmA [Chloroflexi bacterium]|nr:heme ABC exporter ATP-binding protein CcmA [Chloroflexota bacterium]
MRLEAHDISKSFGSSRVLDGLAISLEGGEMVCLLGRNGAGKTTLLRVLSGLLRPSAGEMRLDGEILDFADDHNRQAVGLVMHQPYLYEHLTGLENLRFYSRLYQTGLEQKELVSHLSRVGLGKSGQKPVRGYSRGMKQRLTLARALLHDPKILLLDEPYTGLDLSGSQLLNKLLLEEQEQGRLILATTHELTYAHQIAKRFDLLSRGKIAESIQNEDLPLQELEAWVARFLDSQPSKKAVPV